MYLHHFTRSFLFLSKTLLCNFSSCVAGSPRKPRNKALHIFSVNWRASCSRETLWCSQPKDAAQGMSPPLFPLPYRWLQHSWKQRHPLFTCISSNSLSQGHASSHSFSSLTDDFSQLATLSCCRMRQYHASAAHCVSGAREWNTSLLLRQLEKMEQ